MNTKIKLLNVVSILFLALLVAASTNMPARADDAKETISGTVVAVDWNDEDEVTAIAIRVVMAVKNSENEEDESEVYQDYWVADTKKGRELWNHLEEDVKATGTVTTDEDGVKTIAVTSFEIIQPEEDSDSD